MAKKAIKAALNDLSKPELEAFCSVLIDRKEEPRIRRSAIEDKSIIQITDKIVSAFTENDAIDVVVDILVEIDCNEVAKELEEKQSKGTTAPIPPVAPAPHVEVRVEPKDAAASVPGIAFVKQQRAKLIERVTAISSILDMLLEHGAINHEAYSMVRFKPTNPEKMRELYMYLQNDKARQMFYEALQEHEKFLLEELHGN